MAGFLWMTAIALALIMAGVGYRIGHAPGRTIFVLGIVSAGGLIALASTACESDADKSDWKIADEAAACANPGSNVRNVEALMRIYPSRERLVRYRDEVCEAAEEPPSKKSASRSGGGGFLGFGSSCGGCSNVDEMRKAYEANPIRAESQYRGRTMVVGGKIESIGRDFAVPPRPLVRLKNDVALEFAWEGDHSWLLEYNTGDTIQAECKIERFTGPYTLGREVGIPIVGECRQVSE